MLHSIQRSDFDHYNKVPGMVPIAPAPEKYVDTQTEKRRYNIQSNPYTGSQAASIAKRNARERNRVKQVNDSFNALRKRLPPSIVSALSGGSRRGSGKKLSKVDTLRMVVEYIKSLQGLIDESDAALGITKSYTYEDEGVFAGRVSPYSDSVPSPAASECSSGVSSSYSSKDYYHHYQTSSSLNPVEENDLLDAISWWQQK